MRVRARQVKTRQKKGEKKRNGIGVRVSRQNIPRMFGLSIFILCFIASALFASAVAEQGRQDFISALDQRASAREAFYTTRIQSFNRVLLASASLFSIKDTLNDGDWQRFYQSMHLGRDFPSLQALGATTRVVGSDQKTAYEQGMTAQGRGTGRISPEGDRGEYEVVTFITPTNDQNQRVIGYDMWSDPSRRAAMEKARDSGQPTMTAPVTLVQDSPMGSTAYPAVVIYSPIYMASADISTVDGRRAGLKGFTYIAFRPHDLLMSYEKQTGDTTENLRLVLSDTTDMFPVRLYTANTIAHAASNNNSVERTATIDDRLWRITAVSGYGALGRLYEPASIFLFGTIASGVAALIAYMLLLRRMTRVHEVYENEVERTKDELLALTSHQLRTPASGVKQYVGMLTAGIMGELTPQQQLIAQKAYDANERQLQIINELLYVSKADAGELMIEPREMDITALTQSIVDGFMERAAEKNITLEYSARTPHVIHGDPRYLQMAIENLVSNAIKYSYKDAAVTITLRSKRDRVELIVSDQGVGIAKKDLPRLFNKFDRIDNPLSYSEGGSGLGLFLARQLVVAHGGEITVNSEEGKGSTFTMTLPKNSPITSARVSIGRAKRHSGRR